jgi:hypothetical protein
MKHDFLHDSSGNRSCKRLWGSVVLATGMIFAMILFGYSLSTGAQDPVTASSIINMFLIAGGGLLGISTFEKIGRK